MENGSRSLLSDILKVAFIFLFAVILLSGAAYIMLSVVIKGNEIEVPNVIGRDFVDASKILSESGLDTVKIEGEKYSATLPKGHVLEQDPIPNKKVKPGRVIKVFLSRGTEQERVPRLIGLPVAEVETILKSRGMEMGSVTKVHSDDYPQEGTIIAHTPPADVPAQWGSKVNLLVSLGPLFVTLSMPDLEGMKRQKALELLAQKGLKQGNITYELAAEGQESDVVLRQFPLPDDRVKQGTLVDIVFSSDEVSEGRPRTAILYYTVPHRSMTSEQQANPEYEEDLSPRNIRIELSQAGTTGRIEVTKSAPPGKTISHPWQIKGIAIAMIYVDGIFTETMICKPPEAVFTKQ